MQKKILFCGFLICSLAFLQCLGASSRLLNIADKNKKYLQIFEQYMNRTINPCNDFYSYACDKWSDVHETQDIGEEINEKVNKPLIEFIENYKSLGKPNNLYDKVWNYYTACLARTPYPSRVPVNRFLEYADELDWPLLRGNLTEDALKSFYDNFNWFLKLAKLNRYGMNILIEHTLERSKDDPNEYLIGFDKPILQSETSIVTDYDYLLVALGLVGIERDIGNTMKELYEFGKQLRFIVGDYRNNRWKDSTIDELQSDLPLQKYLEILLGYKVDGNCRLRIRNWNYFEKLTELIRNTPSETVYNYILINFVMRVMENYPNIEQSSCMTDMRRHLEPAINFIYGEHIYRPHAAAYNADVQRIFNTIREAISRRLDMNEMNFNQDEIENSRKKLYSMKLIMNNLPANVDLEFLEDYFGDLQLDSTNFFKNRLATMKFRFDKEYSQLKVPIKDRDKYFAMGKHESIGTCGTFYLYDRNSILLPYCLLQSPMYELELHDVYKFSMFGFLLAHEMLHAFDYFGIDRDFEGKPTRISRTVPFQVSTCMFVPPFDRFQERFVDQFAMRIIHEILFPENTENHIEYSRLGDREKMERQFFEHFAHFFCGDITYSPGPDDKRNDRLYLALRDFQPFIRSFQCKVGDVYTGRECF